MYLYCLALEQLKAKLTEPSANRVKYSLMNMRQLHILFNSAKTWHVIVCWFLCFAPNLPKSTWAEPKIVLNIRTEQS